MKKIVLALVAVMLSGEDLKQIVELSKNSNLANISKLNVEISSLKEQSVKSAYMPSLSLEGGYVNSSGDRGVLSPAQIGKISANVDFVIYDGGKREASIEALRLLSGGEILKTEDRLNFIALSVARLYFYAVAIDSAIEAKQKQIIFLNNLKDKLERFLNAGLAATDEYEAVKAKFHLASVEKLNLEREKARILNDIALFTNAQVAPQSGSRIDLNGTSENKNPKILALQNDFLASLQDVKVASSFNFPTIFLKNSVTFYRAKYDNDYSTLGSYEPFFRSFENKIFKKSGVKNEFALGFRLSLFDFGKTNKDRQIKQIKAHQALLNLEQNRLENSLKSKNLKDELKILQEKLKAEKSAFKASESSFDAVFKKYEVGLAGYADMLESLAQKFKTLADVSLNENEIEIKKAEILYESGEDILNRIIND